MGSLHRLKFLHPILGAARVPAGVSSRMRASEHFLFQGCSLSQARQLLDRSPWYLVGDHVDHRPVLFSLWSWVFSTLVFGTLGFGLATEAIRLLLLEGKEHHF